MEAVANAGRWDDLPPLENGQRVKLSADTLAVLGSMGFEQMTPVQAACIPLFLSHKDVAAEAVTGSGKTLAFVVPIVEMLVRHKCASPKHVGALIISPTRELAEQTHAVVREFAQRFNFSLLLLTGGSDPSVDIAKFHESGANIIVATPGRLLDVIRRLGNFSTLAKELEVLVLDEADRLLDMGFSATLNDILPFLPKQRRTGLFSATQTKEVEALVRAGLRNPVRVSVKVESKLGQMTKQQATPATLTVYYMICEITDKINQMVAFVNKLQEGSPKKIMVYFSTCACVNYFTHLFKATKAFKGIPLLSLHGKITQEARNKALKAFKESGSALLLCTDVAARGLDIPNVDWVLQFDPPQDPAAFVHRCGRTARIGREGNALVFLAPEEDEYVEFLRLRKIPLQEAAPTPGVPNLLDAARKAAGSDRDLYEKGKQAFVSYVRSYKEHQCSYIFQIKRLNLGRAATGFALLHMPSMPELKAHKDAAKDFVKSDVAVSSIPYKDKQREKQRRQKVEAQQAAAAAAAAAGVAAATEERKKAANKRPVQTVAWSKQVAQKTRKEKRKARKAFLSRKDEDDEDEAGAGSKRGHDDDDEDDWEAMAKEARLTKKLKAGKISKEEFEREVDADDVFSDDDDDDGGGNNGSGSD